MLWAWGLAKQRGLTAMHDPTDQQWGHIDAWHVIAAAQAHPPPRKRWTMARSTMPARQVAPAAASQRLLKGGDHGDPRRDACSPTGSA